MCTNVRDRYRVTALASLCRSLQFVNENNDVYMRRRNLNPHSLSKIEPLYYLISLSHRAFLFTIFICSNKCTFFIITPILVSIIKAFKTLKNSYMFRSITDHLQGVTWTLLKSLKIFIWYSWLKLVL
jgi:hypothetical protein